MYHHWGCISIYWPLSDHWTVTYIFGTFTNYIVFFKGFQLTLLNIFPRLTKPLQEAVSAIFATKFFMTPALLRSMWRISIFLDIFSILVSSAMRLLIREINFTCIYLKGINKFNMKCFKKIYFYLFSVHA